LICINKADVYPAGVQEIHQYAAEQGAQVIAEIPFDAAIPRAMVQAQPVTAFAPDSPAAQAIQDLWMYIAERIGPVEA